MSALRTTSVAALCEPDLKRLHLSRAALKSTQSADQGDAIILAQSLRAFMGEETAPTAATLAAMAALQASYGCIIGAHLVRHADLERQLSLDQDQRDACKARWRLQPDVPESLALIAIETAATNPALSKLRTLTEAEALSRGLISRGLLTLRATLASIGPIAPFDALLPDVLARPGLAHPDSLTAQLQWVLEHWAEWLSEAVKAAVIGASDQLAEEERFRGFGPGPVEGPGLLGASAGADGVITGLDGRARYSQDAGWMTEVVLIAKQTYVWLHQLSQQYGYDVHRLDQIPDEALDELRWRGFNTLWLIGLWERSEASRTIKRRRGNPEAQASAYAIDDYVISEALGGDHALNNLRHRAQQRGLRLAADMVPNHVGLDARWVVEHPDWFVGLDHCPYPNYTFNGPDLSTHPSVQIYLEDGYWDSRDAAVVFKRVDGDSGRVDYLYHGNDGTQMPWNDTAQLDYLNPAVREAVLATIVEVARRFPVIRFDAAMTLATKHVQRLWHPAPGHAGAIPTRSRYGASPEDFAAALPREFWAEAVERVAREVPDTLLLAEAFWMMEGYFVRELGMHRVYNSAFMHMLRDQSNQKYRGIIKEALANAPAILERFVNFMNNPDEDTAVAQFGQGDKYFGVVTLMATMPGLPMFGHGQIEGYAEKYGMEYARPYQDEQPDQGLVDHHARVLFPLLRKRHVFGGVANFNIFDAYRPEGWVDENVYVLSNRTHDSAERALVVFNNHHHETAVWIHGSAPINVGDEDAPTRVTRGLVEALDLKVEAGLLYGLYELHSGLWFIRDPAEVRDQGLFVGLKPYGTQVFMEFRELYDHDGRWRRLKDQLGGAGVADLNDALETVGRPPGPYWPPRPVALPERGMGILLHPTSLPGPDGVGTLGHHALDVIGWMAQARLKYWQVLPLCRGGAGHSPYSSAASLVGNPLMIDLDELVELGLLKASELKGRSVPGGERVDFDAVAAWKMPLVERAAERLLNADTSAVAEGFKAWRESNVLLEDTFLFQALDRHFSDLPWWEWPAPLRARDSEALKDARTEHASTIDRFAALAFLFDTQWAAIREHAAERGITLIGDLPIYVDRHSADVWSSQGLFQLGVDGIPERVAAVPPDAFSETGQLWGNPLYRWDAMEADNFSWWVNRLRRVLEWTPMVRLDHFRGFEAYYSVEFGADDATTGSWVKGPGRALFERFVDVFGHRPLVAEDLGEIDEAVHVLRRESGLLCTRVLQFGLDDSTGHSLHLPERCHVDALVYTGTHDNDTTQGWFDALTQEAQDIVSGRIVDAERVVDGVIETAASTPASVVIVPAQDVLRLGSEGRMNVPGVPSGNWGWRLAEGELTVKDAKRLARVVSQTERDGPAER